jgi:hypothetical protein
MAEGHEDRDPAWGDRVARVTFLLTLIGAAVFAVVVFRFIL